ncbi:GNAT family N-acetyltransferase [Oricola sp.]|uniref:GNAT family N-acetyltransferase n=1 Tax=Oricola sp. TaxID=1979950 RepID=UPI000C8DE56E|nr:GNAT family N-acetyltransferase [Ahrensia sp.]|tara:strand:- start:20778 stop:21530 length:753 start_codon:yes stop_codon:yes gene_type:complete
MSGLALVRRLEAVGFRAWPAASVHYDGSWAVRLTAGHPSKRLNSVNPLDPSDVRDIDQRITRAAKRFSSYGRPLVFRLSPLAPLQLNAHFDANGWRRFDETRVMIASLKDIDLDSGIDQIPLQDIGRYVDASIGIRAMEGERKPGLTEVVESIRPPSGMFVLEDDDGPVASALCVHDNDLAGLFDVAVREDQRGKGYARSIVRAALRWAAAQGAQRAWLQVMVANKSAVDLYTRLGFQEAYSYSYRQKGE